MTDLTRPDARGSAAASRALAIEDRLSQELKARLRYAATIYALRRGDADDARGHLSRFNSHLAQVKRPRGTVLSRRTPRHHLDLLAALIDARQGRFSQVVRRLEGPVKKSRQGPEARVLRFAYTRLADQAYGSKNIAQANAWLKAALNISRDPVVAHNLSVIDLKQGRSKKAEKQWRALLGKVPEAGFNLAVALDAQGRLEEAFKAYARYAEGGGPHATRAKAVVEARQRLFGYEP